MYSHRRSVVAGSIAASILVVVTFLLSGGGRKVVRQITSGIDQVAVPLPLTGSAQAAKLPPQSVQNPLHAKSGAKPSVDLTPAQLESVRIGPVGSHQFPVEKEAVGNISFADEQSVQVFPAYQGTIMQTFVQLGSQVEANEPLYTIKSPDLIQAESTLIGAAATFDLTNKELERVKGLPGVAVREVEQAVSDQQTAEGALKAARDAVRVFGKTDVEIDQMIASRKTDPALVVRSPIAGQITSYEAPLGLLVQPGTPPAPYTVSNLGVKWMLADVIESDIGLFKLGQAVEVKTMAYPNRVFRGKVTKIYPTVDSNTHRETIRSQVEDPNDELRPGMLANFVISVGGPQTGIAMPANGVVREPDGTMTVWVTADRHHFEQRIVKTGLRQNNWVQILSGLRRGELAVTDGAVFVDNMLSAEQAE